MDFETKPACWSVASWTLAALCAAVVIAYLFGGFEPGVRPHS